MVLGSGQFDAKSDSRHPVAGPAFIIQPLNQRTCHARPAMTTRPPPGPNAGAPRSSPVLPRQGAPRYMLVADALIADIEQGTYRVGDMLPPELEIAEKYGVSRYTAREAIRRLTEMGLITRRAGVGTTVKSAATQARYTARISDIAELIHYTRQTELKLLKEEWVKVEGELAAILPDARGQTWLRISALRFPRGGDRPISLTDMVVHPSYARIRERIHEPGAAVYRLIEDTYGEKIRELRQDISCTALSAEAGELLGEPPGSPALLVLRYYLGQDNHLMSVSINLYPQDRFTLSTSWRLDWG